MGEPLRLADLLAGLSLAADIGSGLAPGATIRSCVVAAGLARAAGLPEHDVADAFYTALLEHVGCAAFAHETALAFGDELQMTAAAIRTDIADVRDVLRTFLPGVARGRAGLDRMRVVAFAVVRGESFGRRYTTAACEVGRDVAVALGLAEGVARGLYEVGELWNGRGAPQGLRGEEICVAARVALVASQLAILDELGGEAAAVAALRRRAGGMLDPGLVEVAAARAPQLLAAARVPDGRAAVLDAEPAPVATRSGEELADVAQVFGDLADLKSVFTHGHSRGVARIASDAAQRLGMDARATRDLRVAALLHDVGRVAVSDAVWEREGPLTTADREAVRLHAYHSERVLAGSAALAPLAPLAGMHHERLDGSGYHRCCRAAEIPASARLLAAADALQAMGQARPHREALPPERAAEELAAEARAGRLDPDCVAAVLASGPGAPRRGAGVRPGGLSEREAEVLRLVAAGLSNREVARRLVISPRTAEHHVQHIYGKIGVRSRAAAALFAVRSGLMDDG